MKLALLLALSLAAVGATLVAAAPEAEACSSSCKVGPCTIYADYAYAIWDGSQTHYVYTYSTDCI